MANESADKLAERASEFSEKLKAQGIRAEVICESLREFSIKVELPIGRATIYYNPKKNTFKCQRENVNDEEFWLKVLMCWDRTERLPIASDNEIATASSAVDIFVDGSFASETAAYGVVVVQQNQVLWEDSGIVPPTDSGGTRQIVGELKAVLNALEWCAITGIDRITIHFDYQGISKWVTGEWKAKKAVTQQYRDAVRASGIQITWQKVDAHTGVKWNEYVDELARSAAMARNAQPVSLVNPMMELDRTVNQFRQYLLKYDVAINVKRRSELPTAHVQLSVSSGENAWGFLNFYCSQEQTPYPKFHEVLPDEKRQWLEQLWREFKVQPAEDLSEVNYYFFILKRYGSLNFDFRVLAEALDRAWSQCMDSPLDIDRLRYDFVELERRRDSLLSMRVGKKI